MFHLRFVLHAAVLPVLVSCALSGCTYNAQLQPVVIAQDCSSASDHASTACLTPCTGLGKFGHACTSNEGTVTANQLEIFIPPVPPMVGWGDSYDDGTNPCPCWEWVSTVSRGYVRFDLSKMVEAKTVVGASLLWTPKKIANTSATSCVKNLYETTGDWKTAATPAILLYQNLDTVAANAGYVGVTETVKKWFANPSSNWGFMFEPSRANTVAKSNAECRDSLETIRLNVKYK